MLLQRLELPNLRSSVQATIPLPLGTTLFEGDIGAGKSTLLYAIEFALFGPSKALSYDFLLRKGATKASVALSFVVGGESYEVRRAIVVRDGKVSPDKKGTCAL